MDITRILRCVIAFVFLFNIIPFDPAYASGLPNGRGINLSPPLACDDLVGIEHKDIYRIEFALESHLRKFNEFARGKDNVEFRQMVRRMEEIFKVRSSDSIFAPVHMQFLYNEAVSSGNTVCARCRLQDNDGRYRDYYIVFGMDKGDEGIEFSLRSVNTENEFRFSGGRLAEMMPRKSLDRMAIERYRKENEFLIDRFIKTRILSGDFAEIKGRREELGWDRSYPDAVEPVEDNMLPGELWDILKFNDGSEKSLDSFFANIGVDLDKAMQGKNLVFIRVPEGMGLPKAKIIIDEKGRISAQGKEVSVEVRSHASDNAVYIFLESFLFDDLYVEEGGEEWEAGFSEAILMEDIVPYLIHEIGVMHGLDHRIRHADIVTYDVVNALDELWSSYLGYIKNGNDFGTSREKTALDRSWKHFLDFAESRGLDTEKDTRASYEVYEREAPYRGGEYYWTVFQEILKVRAGKISLSENLVTRDYMASKKSQKAKKEKERAARKRKKAQKSPRVSPNRTRTDKVRNDLDKAKLAALFNDILNEDSSVYGSGKKTGSVQRFMEYVSASADGRGYRAFRDILDTGALKRHILSERFRSTLNSKRVKRYLMNVWQSYDTYHESKGPGEVSLDEDQKFLFLIDLMNEVIEEEKRSPSRTGKNIILDQAEYFISIYAKVYHSQDFAGVKASFEAGGSEARKTASAFKEKDAKLFIDRLKKVSDDRMHVLINKAEGAENKNVYAFYNALKEVMLKEGYGDADSEAEKVLVSATASSAEKLRRELMIVSTMHGKIFSYLRELDTGGLGISGAFELVQHLKEVFEGEESAKGLLQTLLIELAASRVSDLGYMKELISSFSMPKQEAGALRKKIASEVSDMEALNRLSEATALITNPLFFQLYLISAFFESPEKRFRNKNELLYHIADVLYGPGKGAFSLKEIFPGEGEIEGLFFKLSETVKALILSNRKKLDYEKAAQIAERYLSLLRSFSDSHEYAREIDEFTDILNQTYVNAIDYNTEKITHLPEDTPVLSEPMQNILKDILRIEEKRKRLWEERGEPLPVGTINRYQVLYAALNGERDYDRVIKFFEEMGGETIYNAALKEVGVNREFSVGDLFNLYFTAMGFKEKTWEEAGRSGLPFLDLCASRLFGEENAKIYLDKIFPSDADRLRRDLKFLVQADSLMIYHYQEGEPEKLFSAARCLGEFVEHQSRVKGGSYIKKLMSDNVYMDIYLRARVIDMAAIEELSMQNKPFFEYFAGKVFGEEQAGAAIKRTVGGPSRVYEREKEYIAFFTGLGRRIYDIRDFGTLRRLCLTFIKFVRHEKNCFGGPLPFLSLMERDILTFYFYSALLDRGAVRDLLDTDMSFMEYFGKGLFTDESPSEEINKRFSVDSLSAEEAEGLQDPHLEFISFFEEIVDAGFENDEYEKAIEDLDLFISFLEHQSGLVDEPVVRMYAEKLHRMRDRRAVLTTKVPEGGTAELIWKSLKQEDARDEKELEERAIEQARNKVSSVEENKKKSALELLSKAEKDLSVAELCSGEGRIKGAEDAFGGAESALKVVADYIGRARREAETASDWEKEIILENVNAVIGEYERVKAAVKEAFRDFSKEKKRILEERDQMARKAEERRKETRARLERRMEELVKEKDRMLKSIFSIIERSSGLIDIISSDRLNGARKSLDAFVSETVEIRGYIENLEKDMINSESELKYLYENSKREVEDALKEAEDALKLLYELLEDAEKKESAELSDRKEKAQFYFGLLRERIALVMKNIEQGRIDAAEDLFFQLEASEYDMYLDPVRRIREDLRILVEEKDREDLMPLFEDYSAMVAGAEEMMSEAGSKIEKALEAREEKKALQAQEDARLYEERVRFREEIEQIEAEENSDAEQKLALIRSKAEDAMGHAKGLLIEAAESIIARSDKELEQVQYYLERTGQKMLSAEGDRRRKLVERLERTKMLRQQTYDVLSRVREAYRAEILVIKEEQKRKEEISGAADIAGENIAEIEELIRDWKLDEAENSLGKFRAALENAERYVAESGTMIQATIGPRKKALTAGVFEIKPKAAELRKNYESLNALFSEEKIRKERETDSEKAILDEHNNIFSLSERARRKIKAGDTEKARVLLGQAAAHNDRVREYIRKLDQRKNRGSAALRKWTAATLKKLTVLFGAEVENLEDNIEFLRKEEDLMASTRDMFQKTAKLLENIAEDISGMKLKLAEGRYRDVQAYIEDTDISGIVDEYSRFVEDQKAALEGTRWNKRKDRLDDSVNELRERAEKAQKETEELGQRLEEASDALKSGDSRPIEDTMEEAGRFCSKALARTQQGDIFAASIYMISINGIMDKLSRYEEMVDAEIIKSDPRGKIKLARTKLHFSRERAVLQEKINAAGEAFEEAGYTFMRKKASEIKAFLHADVREGVTPGQPEKNNISRGLSQQERVQYFRNVLKKVTAIPVKDKTEEDRLTELFSHIALLDLSKESGGHITALKSILGKSAQPDYYKALIHISLYRHGVDIEEHISAILSMWDRGPNIDTEVLLRSFFMEAKINEQEHSEWMESITDLNDEEFAQLTEKGYSNLEEIWIAGSLLLNGKDRKESVDYFNEDILENADDISRLYALYFLARYDADIKYGIQKAKEEAVYAGAKIPTHQRTRFTLFLPEDFYNNGEYEKHTKKFADRFNLKKVVLRPGEGPDSYVDKVLGMIEKHNSDPGKSIPISNDRAVVLVPDTVSDMEKLSALCERGIKFLRVSSETLLQARTVAGDKRAGFQQNAYVIMLLAGLMNEDISRDEDILRLARVLRFFLVSHFELDDVTADKYLQALLKDDLRVLVKGMLLFMPMEHYAMPDYDLVSEFLIRA